MLRLIFLTFLAIVANAAAETCLGGCQQSALAFAYQYGFPLYAYGLFIAGVPNVTTNTLYRAQHLATSANRSVVRPNVDTLYTTMFYDLSQKDLVITVPEIEDRYWAFPFYDMYANNFCNVGSLQDHKPGKYLLRYTDNNFGFQTVPINSTYQGYVNSPTPYGTLLVRILVKNTTDEVTVQGIESRISLSLQNSSAPSHIPPFNLSPILHTISNYTTTLGTKVLQLTANLARYNEPEVLQDRSWVATTLQDAGISNGTFTEPAGTNLTAAVAAANSTASTIFTIAGFTQQLGNNWTQGAPQVSGDFQSFYNARMLIAENGYLQLSPDQAIYPQYTARTLTVAPKGAYLFTFSAKPQLEPTGFWSLTIYGADQYLVPNNLSVYALGDRSNLTYPDGTPLYGQASSSRNGTFQILIQPSDVAPPANWTSNWLPAPAGGGNFSVNLRFYGAQLSMTNGSWAYPVVTVVDAITS